MKTGLQVTAAAILGLAIAGLFVLAANRANEPKAAPKIDGNLLDNSLLDNSPPPVPDQPCCEPKEETWLCAGGHVVTLWNVDKRVCPICGSRKLREYRP